MSKTQEKILMVEKNDWNNLPWKKAERQVFRLQKRIYQASQAGDFKKVHKLQKLLTKSWYAKAIAIRKVTQDNQGKKTAGIDGMKSLTPNQRLSLMNELSLDGKAKPVRRINIPKKNGETRPLGIPTIKDRAKQALAKLALEPEWEAKFEPNSYGFRIGRSAHDAVATIYSIIRVKDYYVLDADIEKCFDKIDHQKLLGKLNSYPAMRRQVKQWLKAGVMETGVYSQTTAGTPQGGVISPLLANIALHGMETKMSEWYPSTYTTIKLAEKYNVRRGKNFNPPILIRYADDFVILHESKILIEEVKSRMNEWLNDIGLNLKEAKTTIASTTQKQDVQWGFNFLGFNVRQYKVNEINSGKDRKGNPLGFKTLIKPSKEAVTIHLRKLKRIIILYRNAPQKELIEKLNPIIRGWTSYYSKVVSSRIFGIVDHHIFSMLKRWAEYRSPMQGKRKVMGKYWSIDTEGSWDFKCKEATLLRHKKTPIKYHIRLKGSKSPYDGDWVYWVERINNYPFPSNTMRTLLKKQKAKCGYCKLYFKLSDRLEIDHIQPLSKGGERRQSNLQLLHRHCHQEKTKSDLK